MATERVVSWKAIANFAQVSREAERTEAALKRLKKTQNEFNASQGGINGNQARSESNSLGKLTAANKAYATARNAANKANSNTVKTAKENVTGQAAGYTALAASMKEVAKQRRALNRANAAAVATPKESFGSLAKDYTEFAEAQKKVASSTRSLTRANDAAAKQEGTRITHTARDTYDIEQLSKAKRELAEATKASTVASRAENKLAGSSTGTRVPKAVKPQASGFDAVSFVAGVRAAAEVRKASKDVDDSLRSTNRTIKDTDVVARRATGGVGGFGRGIRSIRNDASGAGGGVGVLKTALGELNPKWRQNELSAYRFGSVLRASFVPLVITGINLLASLLSPLAAGFIGLAGAIAPVAGLLGTLPGLFFAAAGGVGTLIAGFAGIGGALKAYNTQQKNATKTALTGAKASKTQQKAVSDHADTVASSARAIKSAEQNVADAQKNVTLARKQAREEMERMQKSLRDLALQEEGESLSLEEARQRLQQVNDDPGSTDLQRRQANLAVRQAENSLSDVKDQQDKATKDAADAAKKGVEGSDQVVQAKRAEQDAEAALADAKRSGAKAQRGLDAATTSGAAGVDLYAEAMSKLTPEAQAVVRQLIKMKPLIDALRATAQKGLMPGVLSFLISSTRLFGPLNKFVGIAAKSFGEFFAQVGKALTTDSALERWGKVLGSTNKIIDYFLEAAFNLGVTIANIAVAARPLTEWLVRSVRDWTRSWRAMTSGEDGQKRLTTFFKKTQSVAGQLGRIIGNVTGIVFNLGRGAQGTGKWILNSFERMTKSWKKFTGSVKGQNAIKKWAKDAQPALSQISGLVGDFIVGIAKLGDQTDIAAIIQQIRQQLLPAVLRVFGLFTGETAAHIVSILSNIGDAIATIAGVDTGGIEGFFGTLDTISGAIDSLVTNVPLARNAIALLIGLMATKAAFSFASSLLGVSSAIKTVGGVSKTIKSVRKARSAEGQATSQGAKRAAPSAGAVKKAKKETAKDAAEQAKSASKSGAKRAAAAPVPGTKRGVAGKAEKGSRLSTMGKTAAPKRAAATVAEDGGKAAKGLGALAKIGPKLGFLSGMAPLLESIGGALSALGPVALIVAAVIVGVLFVMAQVYAFSKLFPETFKKNVDAIKAVGSAIVTGLVAAFNFVKQFFLGLLVLASVQFQILRNIFYFGVDLLRITFIRPLLTLVGLVVGLFNRIKNAIAKRITETIATVKAVWGIIVSVFGPPLKRAFDVVSTYLRAAKTFISGLISGLVKAMIDKFHLQPLIDKIKDFNDKVHKNFVTMVDKIKETVGKVKGIVKSAFDKIRPAVANPIGTVIDIINKGIIRPYKSLAKTFGIDTKVSEIDYSVPKFQKGGTIPGVQSQTNRDNVLGVTSKGKAIARVEPGEFIMPRSKKKYFPMLERIRQGQDLDGFKNGGELPGYAKGGSVKLFRPVKGGITQGLHDQYTGFPAIDFGAPVGSKVAAGAAGTVSRSQDIRGAGNGGYASYGRVIQILSGGFETLYAHLSQRGVNKGDKVEGGQVIGLSGNTGHSTGPHLHFGAKGINPNSFVNGSTSFIGKLGEIASSLPNPVTFLKGLYNKVADGLAAVGDSEFGRIVANVPKQLFDGLLNNAKNIFKDDAKADDSVATDPTTMTSADQGKGGAVKGRYARGTNSAMRGPILVGENGPEVIYANGGERVTNNSLTRMLPGYNKGGVVKGMKEGASGDWVRALRSETHQGTSSKWSASFSAFLRSALPSSGLGGGSIGTIGFNNYDKSSGLIDSVVKYLKKQKKNKSIDAIAKALKTDQTTIWQNSSAITKALESAKASKGDKAYFTKTSKSFGSARAKWLKDLEKKTGESQDGNWGEDSDEPAQHMLYHAFGMPHDDYLVHPWQANTATESAIMEQRRSNKINAQFDGYIAQFNDWALTSLVRKLNELGPADGLTLAKNLSTDKSGATEYDKTLAESYARSDASGDSNNKDAQVNLLVSTINAGNGSIGLQGAAQALSLSLDSTAGIYDLAVSKGRLPASSKTARIDKDVLDFRKLFKFATGGHVPGDGNRDSVHAMLTPGEFVLRKAAVQSLMRQFGPTVMGDLNNIDKFAAGGFAGGINTPGYRGSSVNFVRSGSSDTNVGGKKVINNFNTNINNPTLEDGAVSVQKRITKIAQLGLLAGDDR